MLRLFDTHCHLSWSPDQDPVQDQLRRAREAGVEHLLCVATELESARRCREIARSESAVRASAGIHPNDCGHDAGALKERLAELDELVAEGGWSAIGETGLDQFREYSDRGLQRVSLDHHLDLARRSGLPIVIHCRQAADLMLEAFRSHGGKIHGVMHCYSEGPGPLQDFLDLGLHISFAGNLTYPKAEEIRAAARLVPAERLLIETDAPFLAPQPVRGKRNEPAFVRHTLECLAGVREEAPADTAALTTANAERLFPLPGGHEDAA